MRFYIANRPSQEDIDKNPNVLSPSFLRDVPPEGASFKKILKLIKKVDDPFVVIVILKHFLTICVKNVMQFRNSTP